VEHSPYTLNIGIAATVAVGECTGLGGPVHFCFLRDFYWFRALRFRGLMYSAHFCAKVSFFTMAFSDYLSLLHAQGLVTVLERKYAFFAHLQ
jgi:hypothetical protein